MIKIYYYSGNLLNLSSQIDSKNTFVHVIISWLKYLNFRETNVFRTFYVVGLNKIILSDLQVILLRKLVNKQKNPEFLSFYKSVMAITLVKNTELITALIPGDPAVTNRAENE